MQLKNLVMAIALGTFGLGSVSWAAGGGSIFVGGGLASSDADGNVAENNTSYLIDDSNVAYNLMLGVEVNSWLMINAGYQDFGEFDAAAMQTGSTIGIGGEVDVDGIYGGALAHYPIGDSHKLYFYGTLGFMTWDAELNAGFLNVKQSGTDPYYGIGLGGKINDELSWMGGITRYEMDQFDMDTINFNLLWYPGFANH